MFFLIHISRRWKPRFIPTGEIWAGSDQYIGNCKGKWTDLVKYWTQPTAAALQPSPRPSYLVGKFFIIHMRTR